MFTAVRLGVFDRLHDGPASADVLCADLGIDASAGLRLLDACVGFGLLSKADGQYANSEAATVYLRRASERTLAGYILYSDEVLYPMWGHLDDAVREGTHRWKQQFGIDGPIFSHFFRTAEARKTFLDGMHGFGLISSPEVVRIFNLNRFKHIADLGGGTGHLAIAACERYGAMRGTIFDLPAVIEHARPNIAASRASERLSVVPGDFFSDPLPDADLYALGRIFHDWSEEKIRALLAKMYAVLPPGGGVLLAEALLDDDGGGPVHAQMQSLNMLICTEGRERSFEEYKALFEAAGFTDVEARRTGAPLDAVLAIRKE